MDSVISWPLNIVEQSTETKLANTAIHDQIAELGQYSKEWVIGFDIGETIKEKMIVIDHHYRPLSQAILAGLKAKHSTIKIVEIKDLSEYKLGYNDRSFKLDMIRLTAGYDPIVIGDPNVDYMCANRLFINLHENSKLWPILENATLTHIISGSLILTGKQTKDKFYYHYQLGDLVSIIEQRQAFIINDTDECCRMWFETFMPEID